MSSPKNNMRAGIEEPDPEITETNEQEQQKPRQKQKSVETVSQDVSESSSKKKNVRRTSDPIQPLRRSTRHSSHVINEANIHWDMPTHTVFFLVGGGGQEVNYSHTAALLAYESLCRANGVAEDDIFTVSATTLELFKSPHQGNPLLVGAKATNGLDLFYDSFDYEHCTPAKLVKIIQGRVSSIRKNTKYFKLSKTDRVVVKFFGHGSQDSGSPLLNKEFITVKAFEELIKCEFCGMWIDLTYCHSRVYMEKTLLPIVQNAAKPVFISTASSLTARAEYYPKDPAHCPITFPPARFSLYVGAELVALASSTNTFAEYFEIVGKHFVCDNKYTVYYGNNPAVGSKHWFAPSCSPLEFLGFKENLVQQWLSKYFYPNFNEIDYCCQLLRSLPPSAFRDVSDNNSTDLHSICQYMVSRRNWSVTDEEYYFWDAQKQVTTAEYTWIKYYMLPEIASSLKLPIDYASSTIGPVTEDFAAICSTAMEMIKFSAFKSWIYAFESQLFSLYKGGLTAGKLEVLINLYNNRKAVLVERWISTLEHRPPHPSAVKLFFGCATTAPTECELDLFRTSALAVRKGQLYCMSVLQSVSVASGVQLGSLDKVMESEELGAINKRVELYNSLIKVFPVLGCEDFSLSLKPVLRGIIKH